MKVIIPSKFIVNYTGVHVLLGLIICGHADTPTEASNLLEELYKTEEIQNEQKSRNGL